MIKQHSKQSPAEWLNQGRLLMGTVVSQGTLQVSAKCAKAAE